MSISDSLIPRLTSETISDIGYCLYVTKNFLAFCINTFNGDRSDYTYTHWSEL